MMLGAPGYASVFTLQVKVGISGMVARDIKLKLGYQKYLIDCQYELFHEIYEDVMQDKAGDWNRTVSESAGVWHVKREIWRIYNS